MTCISLHSRRWQFTKELYIWLESPSVTQKTLPAFCKTPSRITQRPRIHKLEWLDFGNVDAEGLDLLDYQSVKSGSKLLEEQDTS